MIKQLDKLSFEEALNGLEKTAEELKKDGTTLEEAMVNYERGVEFYQHCIKILEEAKQKIEIFNNK